MWLALFRNEKDEERPSLQIPSRSDFRTGGSPVPACAVRPEGVLPKRDWILPEEREVILGFKRQYPSLPSGKMTGYSGIKPVFCVTGAKQKSANFAESENS